MRHPVAKEDLYLPAIQSTHGVLEATLYRPATQAMQDVAPVFVNVFVAFPATHATHATLPADDVYWPATQAEQPLV